MQLLISQIGKRWEKRPFDKRQNQSHTHQIKTYFNIQGKLKRFLKMDFFLIFATGQVTLRYLFPHLGQVTVQPQQQPSQLLSD